MNFLKKLFFSQTRKDGMLWSAVIAGNADDARTAHGLGADVAFKRVDGKTPLHLAAESGSFALVRLLLGFHANPNLTTDSGDTPLHLGIKSGSLEVVRELTECGADLSAPNRNGDSALHLAVSKAFDSAANCLLERSADPNSRNRAGKTPLHLAAESGSFALVRLLLKFRANPNLTTDCGDTPLHLGVKSGSLEVVRAFAGIADSRYKECCRACLHSESVLSCEEIASSLEAFVRGYRSDGPFSWYVGIVAELDRMFAVHRIERDRGEHVYSLALNLEEAERVLEKFENMGYDTKFRHRDRWRRVDSDYVALKVEPSQSGIPFEPLYVYAFRKTEYTVPDLEWGLKTSTNFSNRG